MERFASEHRKTTRFLGSIVSDLSTCFSERYLIRFLVESSRTPKPMAFMLAALLAAISAAAAPSAQAQALQGPARVIDGDSLAVAGMQVRIFGIDAPEGDQPCFDNGATVPCGQMAKDALASLIGTSPLTCLGKGTDAYGRMVAVCRIGTADLGQALVEAGWAMAFRKYSDDYVAAEARARASKSGMWQWDFATPEAYRMAKQAAQSPPRDRRAQARAAPAPRSAARQGPCVIKGNHSRRGAWIYHLPGMPYYEATRPEAWFCSEEEAQAAGYRRAIVR